MTEYFPYKDRIDRHKHRYVEAYKHGLDTIDDWLSAGPDSDTYTPSSTYIHSLGNQPVLNQCLIFVFQEQAL